MPLRWKIFLAFNFVLALPAVVFLVFLIIEYLQSYRGGEDWILFLFLFGLAMIALNSFINIYLLQRFYPDRLMSARVQNLSIISLVLTSLVTIGLLMLSIYGASMEFLEDNYNRDQTGKIALLIMFVAICIQISVLIMQAKLPRLINRNSRNKMHSLIDSIGKS